ncbi:hypothetical protein LSTR_LSTR005473 [Laodelphax striatellus]|uniref:C2H2-type domain-containing protein n=1 Tax=Laodelphax striatellus TaxID=195883 RepID=A0A482WWV6_LAOST|nr:hypothetical protein LSTR_LSTR005473 [Laodelphax striatellus]
MESVHALVRQKCELCKKTYCSKNELRKHIKSVHWGEKFEYSKRCSLRTHTISAQTIERD